MTLSIMVSRATGMPWGQWVQEAVYDPMGAAKPGFTDQDRQGQSAGHMHLRMEDWIRVGLWIKRSSKESGCFGDYVRSATSTQISNPGTPKSRKHGGAFGGYGYLIWTENAVAPNTAWLNGFAGQRISIDKNSDRQVIVFSTVEDWAAEVYAIARDWNRIGK
jgi:CubicO group peptidase (beta-lactamase class C family)